MNASSDESTPDSAVAEKCRQWQQMPHSQKAIVPDELAKLNAATILAFTEALEKVIIRTIKNIRIIPIHGRMFNLPSATDAISFIESYQEQSAGLPIIRYEIQIVYENGNEISGKFTSKTDTVEFLKSYLPALEEKAGTKL